MCFLCVLKTTTQQHSVFEDRTEKTIGFSVVSLLQYKKKDNAFFFDVVFKKLFVFLLFFFAVTMQKSTLFFDVVLNDQ